MPSYRSFAFCAALVIGAACAASKPPATAALPTPLVTALLNDRGVTRPAPRYVVDALPERYPQALVPTGRFRVVGGMTNGDEIVAVFADSTRRLSAVLEAIFAQSGFTRPQPTPGSGFSSGGGPFSYFCRDSATVTAEPLTGSNRDVVRVTYRIMHGRFSCTPSATGLPPDSRDLHIPPLTPPNGVRSVASHGGYSSSAVSSSADLTGTSMVPGEILAHFAAQLTAAGWTATAPATSDRLAGQGFQVKAPSGAMWEGFLLIYGSSTAMTASLAMHPLGNP